METNNDKKISFKYEYRNYQKRALNEINFVQKLFEKIKRLFARKKE